MARMDTGQRSDPGFEELVGPVDALVPVEGHVSRVASAPSTTGSGSEDGRPADPIDTLTRASWLAVLAVSAAVLALVMGDDGPWIVVVPGLAALGGVWLDRRIEFSFAEGFIGYCGDPEPAQGALEQDWPSATPRRVSAAS
jgi:hypothetical protein